MRWLGDGNIRVCALVIFLCFFSLLLTRFIGFLGNFSNVYLCASLVLQGTFQTLAYALRLSCAPIKAFLKALILLRLWCEAQIRFHRRIAFRETLFNFFFIFQRRNNHNIFTLLPVRRRSDFMLVS